MKSVAVCGASLAGTSYCDSTGLVALDGKNVTVGRVLEPDPTVDLSERRFGNSILVRVRAFSCNYRDRALITFLAGELGDLSYCHIGSDFVADVIAVGQRVTSVRPGDRVIGNCQYPNPVAPGIPPGIPTQHASQRFHVFDERQVVRVPPEMEDRAAAGFSVGAQTAFSMVRAMSPPPGSRILITAANSNTSLFVINALASRDVELHALTTSLDHEDQLRKLGVSRTVKVRTDDASFVDNNETLKLALGLSEFDYVVDPFADLYLEAVMDVMKNGATYVTCGVQRQGIRSQGPGTGIRLDVTSLMSSVILKGLRIVGNCLGQGGDLRAAIGEHQQGRFPVVVDSVFAGNDVCAFFERTYNSPDRFGKVVYQYE